MGAYMPWVAWAISAGPRSREEAGGFEERAESGEHRAKLSPPVKLNRGIDRLPPVAAFSGLNAIGGTGRNEMDQARIQNLNKIGILVTAVVITASIPLFALAQENIKISDLPKEAKDVAKAVSSYCKENGTEGDTGLPPIQNLGDDSVGRRLVLFQPAAICGYRDKGNGACSTDGCDFYLFTDDKNGRWTRVALQSEVGIIGFPKGDKKPAIIVFRVRGDDPLCKEDRQSSCVISLTWDGPRFSVRKIQ